MVNFSSLLDKYFGIYANAHRGKVRKSEEAAGKLVIIEEEVRRVPRRGWAEMIRKVYEVDPLVADYFFEEQAAKAFRLDGG